MAQMMKNMGLGTMHVGAPSDAALLAELGGASNVKEESADDIMRSLGLDPNKADEDMSDTAMLRELEEKTDPMHVAQGLKDEIESLKQEAKDFAQSGDKANALARLRESKVKDAELKAHMEEHGITEKQLTGEPEVEESKAGGSDSESLIQLYETYHSVEELDCISASEYERQRNQDLLKVIKDDILRDELDFRIETLQNNEDSIKSDIGN